MKILRTEEIDSRWRSPEWTATAEWRRYKVYYLLGIPVYRKVINVRRDI